MATCRFVDADEDNELQSDLIKQPEIDDKLKAILAEYETLRSEILTKMQLQHNLFQFHVVALTGIIAAILIPNGLGWWALFLIPIESSIIGIWYVDHDTGIIKIGNYIQTFIEPRVCSMCNEQIMNWENFVRSEKGANIVFNTRITRVLSFLAFEGLSISILLITLGYLIVHRSEISVVFKTEQSYVLMVWVAGFIITSILILFERYRYNFVEK